MSLEPSATAKPRGHWRLLVLLAALGLLLLAGLAGGWLYLKSRADTAGLEGTWRQRGDASHTYRFRSNGDVDAWYRGLPMGNFLTWRRDGRRIAVHSTRGWDFVSELGDGEIRGRQTIRDNAGGPGTTAEQVWRRE
jgi:hypothetical protein